MKTGFFCCPYFGLDFQADLDMDDLTRLANQMIQEFGIHNLLF